MGRRWIETQTILRAIVLRTGSNCTSDSVMPFCFSVFVRKKPVSCVALVVFFRRKRVEVVPDEEGEMYVPSFCRVTPLVLKNVIEESRRADEWSRGTIL